MVYFSVTVMVAMVSPLSSEISAISSPSLMLSAWPCVVEIVIGIGQKVPSAMVKLSQTPCQSALVIKPVSGVKPPMPIMIRSPASREEMRTWVRLLAFSCSAASSAPVSNRGINFLSFPCGLTKAICVTLLLVFVLFKYQCARLG